MMQVIALALLALLLIAAQSFATAHFHQRDLRTNLTHSAQDSDSLCSLCLFHFHGPVSIATPPATAELVLVTSRLTPEAKALLHALAIARVLTRGPPPSL